jgi:predicted helicase
MNMNLYFDIKLIERPCILPQLFSISNAENFVIYVNEDNLYQDIFFYIAKKPYQYIVSGKSVIEWIMERYIATTHKESSIKNDPNDWTIEHNNPRYILDLLLSVITVSPKTADIVSGFPNLEWW